jgi:periplasmic protein CpxP/Spy
MSSRSQGRHFSEPELEKIKSLKAITGRQIMKRMRQSTVIITAVLFCMAIVFGNPLFSGAQTGAAAPKSKMSETDRAEARINELHAKLKITQAQEAEWNKVAQVMRENATAMEALIKARKENKGTLNAVDSLKSYSEITDAHATGLKNFIVVFQDLYASMSDDQKKMADSIFTKHDHKKKSKKK